jgi:hypothetical protein
VDTIETKDYSTHFLEPTGGAKNWFLETVAIRPLPRRQLPFAEAALRGGIKQTAGAYGLAQP